MNQVAHLFAIAQPYLIGWCAGIWTAVVVAIIVVRR